jgi:hypothetical protein
MRRAGYWNRFALGAAAMLACGEVGAPAVDPQRLPVIDSVRLFRCDENYPLQIACGLLQNVNGFWLRSPGSKEFGPIDPADVVLDQRYSAWAYYRDTRLVRADLCWLPDTGGRFCSNTETFALADTGAARVGHWAAIFVLFRPGDWRVIFWGESALGTTADSIVMHVDSITAPPPPPLTGSRERGAVRCGSGEPGAVLDGAHRSRASAPPSTALCSLLARASRLRRPPAAIP